ncbi:PAS domain-containing protein [Archangium sp.]|uniref:PAS domain-containing protein n=1 Tax=Archangium sp. TaxID=1872627 RepID=UPI00286A8013|nr:PAS domain-containing protein [Archangium sp.]
MPPPCCSPAFVAELASSTEVVHLPDATTAHLALGEGVRASGIHSLLGLRMYPRDGTERWLSANGRAFFDASGKAVRFIGTVLDITERGRAHQAVERERHRATTLLESISEAFFAVDPTWRFTYVNREAERLLGHRREELLGRDHWEIFPSTVGPTLERQYRRAATERLPLAFEERDPQRDLWFDIRVYPSTEGLAVFFRDITDTKPPDTLGGFFDGSLACPPNAPTGR